MARIMLINASPRAPKSNSSKYAKLFKKYCGLETAYYEVGKGNHLEIIHAMEGFSDIVFVFPLYADSLPVTLLNFLKSMECSLPKTRPTVSILINCGFLEPWQNNVAVDMIKLFCRGNGYPVGSVLKIGSGEAILTTPFRVLLNRKMKKFAASIENRRHIELEITMPISKGMFIKASTVYWENYGKKNGIDKAQMETMDIES